MNWQYPRTMTPGEFKGAIQTLGMSNAAAARYLGLSERQVSRMVHGAATVPTAIVLLLWFMMQHGELPVVPPRVKGTY